mmetsp:Transcript_1655/g.3657  ORF Transcript_1655/g.3657 Transcript_1655/m.3657 type:complete len:229 (+) Transcript_1655:622-1308(+)
MTYLLTFPSPVRRAQLFRMTVLVDRCRHPKQIILGVMTVFGDKFDDFRQRPTMRHWNVHVMLRPVFFIPLYCEGADEGRTQQHDCHGERRANTPLEYVTSGTVILPIPPESVGVGLGGAFIVVILVVDQGSMRGIRAPTLDYVALNLVDAICLTLLVVDVRCLIRLLDRRHTLGACSSTTIDSGTIAFVGEPIINFSMMTPDAPPSFVAIRSGVHFNAPSAPQAARVT